MGDSLVVDSSVPVYDLSTELFQERPFDGGYQEVKFNTYYPNSPLNSTCQTYAFDIKPLKGKGGFLTNTMVVLMDLKMLNKHGNRPDKDIVVAPVANVMHSFFSKVGITIMNKDLNQTNDFYAPRAYLQTIMNNDQTDQINKCFCSGLLRDTCFKYDSVEKVPLKKNIYQNFNFGTRKNCFYHFDPKPTTATAPAYENKSGFVDRAMTFCGPIHHVLCLNDRPIPWGTAMMVKLTRSKKDFILMCREEDNDKDYDLIITRLELRMQVATFSPQLIMKYERLFADNKVCRFYYRRFDVAQKLVP